MGRLLPVVMTVALAAILGAGTVRTQDPRSGATPAGGKSGADSKAIPIWPGVAPGSERWTQKEVEYKDGGKAMVRNVTTPTLTAYLPDPAVATGAAVIVCPG